MRCTLLLLATIAVAGHPLPVRAQAQVAVDSGTRRPRLPGRFAFAGKRHRRPAVSAWPGRAEQPCPHPGLSRAHRGHRPCRPALNAVIELNPDALADADALDAERKAGKLRGPLHGIPVLLKDNIDTDADGHHGRLAGAGRAPADARRVPGRSACARPAR